MTRRNPRDVACHREPPNELAPTPRVVDLKVIDLARYDSELSLLEDPCTSVRMDEDDAVGPPNFRDSPPGERRRFCGGVGMVREKRHVAETDQSGEMSGGTGSRDPACQLGCLNDGSKSEPGVGTNMSNQERVDGPFQGRRGSGIGHATFHHLDALVE